MVKAVIFDIGNVLLTWAPDRLFAALIPDPVRRAAFQTEVDFADLNRHVDQGAPFQPLIDDAAHRHPGFADVLQGFHDHWIDAVGPPIAGSWALFDQLRADGVPLYALSNFGAETFERARTTFPELDRFDRLFLSGRLGLLKPDPAIYAHVEAETGLSGPDLFFTDDVAENIEAARARGWLAHHFDGADGLAGALRAAGLVR